MLIEGFHFVDRSCFISQEDLAYFPYSDAEDLALDRAIAKAEEPEYTPSSPNQICGRRCGNCTWLETTNREDAPGQGYCTVHHQNRLHWTDATGCPNWEFPIEF